jgi:hypothetical protein
MFYFKACSQELGVTSMSSDMSVCLSVCSLAISWLLEGCDSLYRSVLLKYVCKNKLRSKQDKKIGDFMRRSKFDFLWVSLFVSYPVDKSTLGLPWERISHCLLIHISEPVCLIPNWQELTGFIMGAKPLPSHSSVERVAGIIRIFPPSLIYLYFIFLFFFLIPFYLQAVQIHLANGVKLLEAWRGVLNSTPPYK